ncbi:MAG: PAS domain S-box protein [Pseudomonadota bacterium]
MDTVSQNTRYAALLAVLDSALDAIITMDARGRVLTYNPAAERMFGYTADEILGQPLQRLMTKHDAAHHDRYVDNYVTTGQAQIIGLGREVPCRRKDGSTFYAKLTVSETETDGERIFTGILHDLTDRHEVQARASAMGDIVEHAASAIFVLGRSPLRIVYANAAARAAWDTERDVSGKAVSVAFDAAGVAALERAMADIGARRNRVADFRAWALRADGSGYSADVHVFGGAFGKEEVVVASLNDVSEQEQAERALERKRHEQALLMRYAPIGIVLLDRDGTILLANDAALTLCGQTESELVGTAAIDQIDPADRPGIRRQFLRMVTGRANYLTSTHQLMRGDGSLIPVRTYNAVIPESLADGPALLSMFEDLSEEYARDAELTRQRERLAHVGRLSQLGEMAAGLAHELNQPLAAISAYASAGQNLVDSKSDDPRLASAFERIAQQARRAGDVIRKLRSLATRGETQAERLDVDSVIRGLLTLVEIDLRHTGVRLHLSLAANRVVLADRVQIEQVLLNFVRNAIEVCGDLPGERRVLTIATREVGDAVRVEVADLGPGIDAALKSRLFDPFVSGKASGMGMGLSISKTIIEAHGGSIGVDDRQPEGAVFWFTLPMAEAGDEAA